MTKKLQKEEKILNFLGLIQRAGKLVTGFDAVKLGLMHKKIKVIFIASDLSENTKEKLNFLNRKQHVPIYDMLSSKQLSSALGKERKIVAVTDQGFSQAIVKKIE